MGWRFYRRIRLLPGVTLNVGKQNLSVSFGPRGAKYTVGTKGSRFTVGLPGTGLFYTVTDKDLRSSAGSTNISQPVEKNPLPLGFFEKLFVPKNESAFADASWKLSQGDTNGATMAIRNATEIVDGAFLAAVLLLNNNESEKAKEYIEFVRKNSSSLGQYYGKYRVSQRLAIPIINDKTLVYEGVDSVAVELVYMAICEELGLYDSAIEVASALNKKADGSPELKCFIAKLLYSKPNSKMTDYLEIVRLDKNLTYRTQNLSECEIELQHLMGQAVSRIVDERVDSLRHQIEGKSEVYCLPYESFNAGTSFFYDRLNNCNRDESICVFLGTDESNSDVVCSIAKSQNLIIAGASGTGRTNLLNTIILSSIFSKAPNSLRFVIIDPKGIDHVKYNSLPHLLLPVVTNVNRVKIVLSWVTAEIERRKDIIKINRCTNITSYNAGRDQNSDGYLPEIMMIIDDFNIIEDALPDCIATINCISEYSKPVGVHVILSTNNIANKTLNLSCFCCRAAFMVGMFPSLNKFMGVNKCNYELDDFEAVIAMSYENRLLKMKAHHIKEQDIDWIVAFWARQDKSDINLYKQLLPFYHSKTIDTDDLFTLVTTLGVS